jgi:NADPH-dependent 2,4-dienoyl-CoA reductase/sulfur reductase-like enzyme
MNIIDTDILIIGSGPAGLSAAIAAQRQGARRVYVAERLPYPGGLLYQCIHRGFGARLYGRELTGPEYADRLIAEARQAGTAILTDTFVTEIKQDHIGPDGYSGMIVRTLSPRKTGEAAGLSEFHAGVVVLATGCRERTIGQVNADALSEAVNGSRRGVHYDSKSTDDNALCVPLITGARPSGVYTAGAAQHMINIGGHSPGKRAVILGSGDIGLIVARRLILTGTEVVLIVEKSDAAGGMAKNIRNSIDAYSIPFLPGHTVSGLHGDSWLEAVTIIKTDPNGLAVPGSERVIPCDTLILSVGLIPETDLLTAFLKDNKGAGIPQNLLICGNAAAIRTMADDIADDGTAAGVRALQILQI